MVVGFKEMSPHFTANMLQSKLQLSVYVSLVDKIWDECPSMILGALPQKAKTTNAPKMMIY